MVQYTITPIYTKSLFSERFIKVDSLTQLRGYHKDTYLYEDNKPNTKPFNAVKVVWVAPKDSLKVRDIQIIKEADMGILPPHMIKIGEYHIRHGKRLA